MCGGVAAGNCRRYAVSLIRPQALFFLTPASCERVARERAPYIPPLTSVRGIAYSTPNVGLSHTRLLRGGCRRARRGRARLDFCQSKSKPSAPEHCGREFSGHRNDAVTAERRPCEFKGMSANEPAFLAEAAKGVRGKAQGFSPMGAKRPGCGARRGEAAP